MAPTETRPGRAPQGARTWQALTPTTKRQRPPPRGTRARRIAHRCMAEANEINEGTHNKGSIDDEAEASAARCAYTACAAAAARRACAAIVAGRTAKGSVIDDGAFDEGSDDDEAAESAPRRGYASAASNDDEASAPGARHSRAANSAPMHSRGQRDQQRGPQRGLPRQRGRGKRRKESIRGLRHR